MSHTIYATFGNPEDAERAAGALLDHGVRAEDLSVVRQNSAGYVDPYATPAEFSAGSLYGVGTDASDITATRTDIANGNVIRPDENIDDVAKHGITTTTAGDAGAGAIKGTMVGAGIGAIAALAALIVPGVGIVLGAGALASAIGGVVATAGAGAAAGAIVGYLKDMGVDDEVATEYDETVRSGGAILAVTLPSNNVEEAEAMTVLNKYAATNVNRYAARGYVA